MTHEQVPVSHAAEVSATEDHGLHLIYDDLAYQRLMIANIQLWGVAAAGDRQWVLIDAGVPGTAGRIKAAAAERFGPDARAAAIIMTHGHFDHVGALHELAETWDAPIYAHDLEHPFLNGQQAYPPPDPTVGGGLMAAMAGLYPRQPVDVRQWLQSLPADGTVPAMPGWRWIHTPGHTPGHISLWRAADRTLIAGDAVITTRQESAFAVLTQAPELHGPPMYYTPDWAAAREFSGAPSSPGAGHDHQRPRPRATGRRDARRSPHPGARLRAAGRARARPAAAASHGRRVAARTMHDDDPALWAEAAQLAAARGLDPALIVAALQAADTAGLARLLARPPAAVCSALAALDRATAVATDWGAGCAILTDTVRAERSAALRALFGLDS